MCEVPFNVKVEGHLNVNAIFQARCEEVCCYTSVTTAAADVKYSVP
jgi:hypothetical protein